MKKPDESRRLLKAIDNVLTQLLLIRLYIVLQIKSKPRRTNGDGTKKKAAKV